ncbi:MAG: hypothetical protein WAW61_21640, partial [Methylococcaceae bacterium]
MIDSLRPDAEDRKKAAFHGAARAISEQFDGAEPSDSECVGRVLQALAYMVLTNGGRLSLEHSLANFKIFHDR